MTRYRFLAATTAITASFMLSTVTFAEEVTFTLGVGVAIGPEYEGSEDYEVGALPMFGVEWEADHPDAAEGETDISLGLHGAELSFPQGLSVDFLRLQSGGHQVMVGLGASYDMGRDASDSDGLRGMGDIDGYAVGSLGLAYENQNGVFADVGLNQSISSDDRGATVDLALGYRLPLSQSVMLMPAVSTVWASEDHMQSYFGVSSTQATSSGNRRFDAGSGFKSVGVGATALWFITDSWGVMANAEYAHLIGDAADSPLVKDKGDPNQFSSVIGLSYRF